MKKTLSFYVKVLAAVICLISVVFVVDTVRVRADSGETVRVSTAKELKAAIKRADVGTVIFRTQAHINVTIKSAAGAKSKELIVDAPNATVTNKAVFGRINILSVNEFVEKASGNTILMSGISDGIPMHLSVAAKKKVKSLTIYDANGHFYDGYTLRKGAKLKALELVYAGNTAPVKSSGSLSKKQFTIKYTNPYAYTCSQKITVDADGRMTRVICDSDSAEFVYDYTFVYDENGNITKLSGKDNESGEFTTKHTYSGNLLQKTVSTVSWSSSETDYNYDKKGRLIKQVTSQEDSMDGLTYITTWTVSFKYDKKGRLISEKNEELTHYPDGSYDDYSSVREETYKYNSKGFMTGKQSVGKYPNYEYTNTYAYEYSKAGDLIKETFSCPGDGSESAVEVNEYSYDEYGEPLY